MVVLSATARRHIWAALQDIADSQRRDNGTCEECRDEVHDVPGWGAMQVSVPIIVGVGCLLVVLLVCIWAQCRKHPLSFAWPRSYLPYRIRQWFSYKRIRRVRVRPDSQPGTIDGHTSGFDDDSHFESTTPLDQRHRLHNIFPTPRLGNFARRSWWNFVWKHPQRVVPADPCDFYIESDMGSHQGHHGGLAVSESHASTQETSSWTMISSNLTYDRDKDAGTEHDPRVLLIGQDFSTVMSSPVSERHDNIQEIRGICPTPDSRSCTPKPARPAPKTTTSKPITPPTPPSSPPMYTRTLRPLPNIHGRVASYESLIYPSRSDQAMLFPASVRAAGYPHHQIYVPHLRQPSTDSMLAVSSPMTPSSGIY